MKILEGTIGFIVDKKLKKTSTSIIIYKEEDLEIGDIFFLKTSKSNGEHFKVVGFTDSCPLLEVIEIH